MKATLLKLFKQSLFLSLVIVLGICSIHFGGPFGIWLGKLYAPSLLVTFLLPERFQNYGEIWMLVAMVFQTFLIIYILETLIFGMLHLTKKKVKA